MAAHGHHRRRVPLIACVVAVLGLVACSSNTTSARDELRKASEAAYPSAYRFKDIPDAPGLQECVSVQRAVVGQVDMQRSIAAFGFEDDRLPVVVWTNGRAYVRSSAVTDGRTSEWLAVDAATPDEHRSAMTNALGPSLAAYFSADSFPPSPADLAAATSRSAKSIDSDGERVIRAVVGDDALEAAADDEADFDLELRFQLDATGRVDRISARAATGQTPDTFGFTVDYDWTPTGAAIAVPSDSEVIDVIEVDPSRLRSLAQPSGCSIGP